MFFNSQPSMLAYICARNPLYLPPLMRDWLDDPFNTPPLEPVPEQLTLVLS